MVVTLDQEVYYKSPNFTDIRKQIQDGTEYCRVFLDSPGSPRQDREVPLNYRSGSLEESGRCLSDDL